MIEESKKYRYSNGEEAIILCYNRPYSPKQEIISMRFNGVIITHNKETGEATNNPKEYTLVEIKDTKDIDSGKYRQKELIQWISKNFTTTSKNVIIFKIYEFFKNNIIIPKGKTPHKHADVMHAYAEGANIEFFDRYNNKWRDPDVPTFAKEIDYRIKQENPVYEYLWLSKDKSIPSSSYEKYKYLTDEESSDFLINKIDYDWIKVEQTKRERK